MKLKINKIFTKEQERIKNKKNKDQIEKITYYKFVLNYEIKDK
jgi:hypothetical protein